MKNKSFLNNLQNKQPNKVYLPLLLFVALSLCFAKLSHGQTPGPKPTATTFKNWTAAAESSNHIDVSYCVMKCNLNANNQVFISVFNENPTTQNVSMTVVIKNNDNKESFASTINYTAGAAALVKPDCSVNENTAALKIALPADYNPENITVTINFN